MNDNTVILELDPFESGVLLGVMMKELNNSPYNNNPVKPIYNRLSEACLKKFYEVTDNDEGRIG